MVSLHRLPCLTIINSFLSSLLFLPSFLPSVSQKTNDQNSLHRSSRLTIPNLRLCSLPLFLRPFLNKRKDQNSSLHRSSRLSLANPHPCSLLFLLRPFQQQKSWGGSPQAVTSAVNSFARFDAAPKRSPPPARPHSRPLARLSRPDWWYGEVRLKKLTPPLLLLSPRASR